MQRGLHCQRGIHMCILILGTEVVFQKLVKFNVPSFRCHAYG